MRRVIIPSALLSLSARLMSVMGRGDKKGYCLKASSYITHWIHPSQAATLVTSQD
jgi:hypothetical protein